MFALLILFISIFSMANISAMEIVEKNYSAQEKDLRPRKKQKLINGKIACIVKGCRKYSDSVYNSRIHFSRRHADDFTEVWGEIPDKSLVKDCGHYSKYETSKNDVLDGWCKCNYCNYYFFGNSTWVVTLVNKHYCSAHRDKFNASYENVDPIVIEVEDFVKYCNMTAGLKGRCNYRCKNCDEVLFKPIFEEHRESCTKALLVNQGRKLKIDYLIN